MPENPKGPPFLHDTVFLSDTPPPACSKRLGRKAAKLARRGLYMMKVRWSSTGGLWLRRHTVKALCAEPQFRLRTWPTKDTSLIPSLSWVGGSRTVAISSPYRRRHVSAL